MCTRIHRHTHTHTHTHSHTHTGTQAHTHTRTCAAPPRSHKHQSPPCTHTCAEAQAQPWRRTLQGRQEVCASPWHVRGPPVTTTHACAHSPATRTQPPPVRSRWAQTPHVSITNPFNSSPHPESFLERSARPLLAATEEASVASHRLAAGPAACLQAEGGSRCPVPHRCRCRSPRGAPCPSQPLCSCPAGPGSGAPLARGLPVSPSGQRGDFGVQQGCKEDASGLQAAAFPRDHGPSWVLWTSC